MEWGWLGDEGSRQTPFPEQLAERHHTERSHQTMITGENKNIILLIERKKGLTISHLHIQLNPLASKMMDKILHMTLDKP